MIHSTVRANLPTMCILSLASCMSAESPTASTDLWMNDRPLFQTSGPACAAPPPGLVSWWPGQGNADDIHDGNHGTIVNSTFNAGKVGQAFEFAQDLEHVRIPHNASLNPPSNGTYTLEFWIKTQGMPEGHPVLVEKFTSPSFPRYPFAVRLNTGDIRFNSVGPKGTLFCGVFDGSEFPYVWSNLAVDDNQFHHGACVYNNDLKSIEVYIDGELDGVHVYSTLAAVDNEQDVFFGLRGNRPILSDFDGLLDEISYYSRALNALEIQNIYEAGGAGKCRTPDAFSALLIDNVVELVDAGTLKAAHAKRLLNELDKAVRRFQDGDADKGCKQLEKFVAEVAKLIDQGKLGQADGQPLIDAANQIMDLACG